MLHAEFTTERVARIAASIDLEPEASADILAASGLEEEAWELIEQAELDAIRQGLERDDTARLASYDAAYLARIEEERGPITSEEYESIIHAYRTATAGARLAELEIPEAAEMVLVRAFEARAASGEGGEHR